MIRDYVNAVLSYIDALLRLAIALVFIVLFIGAALLHNALNYPFAYFRRE